MSGFKSQPLGMLMEPDPGNPQEVEGVLNPAAARCPDGELYLFPRLVARGNYSRIGTMCASLEAAECPCAHRRQRILLNKALFPRVILFGASGHHQSPPWSQ